MSDFDLDNSFRDDFENQPFEEPTNDKWSRLEAGLDARDAQRKRRRMLSGWLPTLLGALLVSFVCWQWQLSDLRAERLELRVAQLEAAVEQCRSHEKQSDFSKKEQVGKVAGSIQNSGNNDFPSGNELSNPAFPHGFNPAPSSHFFENNSILGNEDLQGNPFSMGGKYIGKAGNDNDITPNNLTLNHALEPTKTDKSPEGHPTNQSFSVPEKLPARPLQSLPLMAKPDFHIANWSIFDNDLKMTPARSIQKAPRNRRWAIGLGVGLPFTSQPDLPTFKGSTGSLSLQYAINEKWRLMGGIESSDFKFSTATPMVSEIPAPPNPDDVFQRLEGAISEESYALGARRQFLHTKQVQPFVSAEWVGINRISTKRDYLFTPANSPSSTLMVSEEDSTPHFNGNNLRIGGGASWKILRWLEWNAQVSFMNEQFRKDTRVDFTISSRILFLF